MPRQAPQSRATRFRLVAGCLGFVLISAAAETNDANRLKPYQAISVGAPPRSPATFDPDPNKLWLPTNLPPATNWSRNVSVSSNTPPASPPQFNPDPGATLFPPSNVAP